MLLCKQNQQRQEAPHGRNARLTPVTRAELVEVLSGWPQAEVARVFRVSRATVAKWVRRFRAGGTGPLQPSPQPPRPISCRKRPSALHADACLGAAPHRVAVGHRPLHRLRVPAPRRTPRRSIAPHGRSFATSMPAPARWTSIKKLGRSAASASCPASQTRTARPPPGCSTSSTWPWMTTPAMPTSRPCRTNAARRPPPSLFEHLPTSAWASPPSAS